jgi:DNA-binding SARP family transcriptional activator/tetratricopeptide (TPR) repeat protein
VVEFRVLGPVEVWSAGRAFPLANTKQRGVLAALLADAGTAVSAETLIDRVWDESPPPQARNALYAHLSRLRRLLTQVAGAGGVPVTVNRRSGGYAIDVEPDRVDMHRMRRLIDRAGTDAGTGGQRAAVLREAVGLWRGEPLTGLPGRWAAQVRRALHEQRAEAAASWTRLELELGNAEAMVGPVTVLLGEYPLAEPLVAAAMRVLAVTGRRARALDCYAVTRARLAEELGVDPGPELQDLHRAILRGQPVPVGPAAGPRTPRWPTPQPPAPQLPTPRSPTPRSPAVEAATVEAAPVPAMLPLDVYGFVGRAAELDRLDAVLASATGHPTSVIISAIEGTAGVGKTALAVHWAHLVADRFPDGQLYINLRGFDPSGSAVTPVDAVRTFVNAFGVPPHLVPDDTDALVGMYRSLLARRRVLVLLDNARDAQQVRPLLPGSPTCLAVVTSRRQLTGLVAAEGAHPLTLDLLTPAESRQLLTGRLGEDRVATEPDAVDDIVRRCARLPLALAVAAARAASSPGLPLEVLVRRIQAAGGGLDAFSGDDAATDVRRVLSWSYHALDDPVARLYRLLSVAPGPDITAPAAASLAGVPVARADAALAELVAMNLASEATPGRFARHDLLRAHATELAERTETARQRDEALLRLLDHYLHTAHAATGRLQDRANPLPIAPAGPGVTPEPIADSRRARDWFAAEQRTLLALIPRAAEAGHDTHAWQLAVNVATDLERRGLWREWVDTHTVALAAAERLGDPAARAHGHRGLGRACVRLRRYDEAHAHFRRAIELFRQVGDHTSLGRVHLAVSGLYEQQRGYREALVHARSAVQQFTLAGERAGRAVATNAVGWFSALLGDSSTAVRLCREALTVLHEHGDRYGEAVTWDSLGYAYHHLGDHTGSVDCFQRSLALLRDLGDRYNQLNILRRLADVYEAMGDAPAARRTRDEALRILDDFGHPELADVRARLGAVPVRP